MVLDDSVYYKKRLLDIGNGRMGAFTNSKSRYVLKKVNIQEDQIIELGEFKFMVGSEKNPDLFYQVDMLSGFCECKAGANCGPCKHKDAVSKFFKIAEFSVLPNSDKNIRGLYHYIADGIVCTNSWYRDLNNPDQVDDVSTFVENRKSNVTSDLINGEDTVNPEIPSTLRDDSSDDNDSGKSDVDEETVNNFITAMDALKAKVVSSYDKTLGKGVKYFTKKLLKFSKQNNTSLEKSLFSVGKELSRSKTCGKKKKKNSKLIPVQVTAKSRREYKHRGRVVGNIGRRTKDQEQRLQMVVTDEVDNVYHTLPKQKKIKNKQLHSLKEAVDSNRPGSKKH